jgi:hypothetical protein
MLGSVVEVEEIATLGVVAVGGKRVDLVTRVEGPAETVTSAASRVEPHHDHVVVARRPFALDSQQA